MNKINRADPETVIPPGRLTVKIKGKNIPRYQSEQAAGCDLHASTARTIIVPPGGFATVRTGISIELPAGYEAQVRPRSGLARNHGIGVLNAPGTIDPDYRGEIMVILFNIGSKPFPVHDRDRIAQLVFSRVERPRLRTVTRLRKTRRGAGGFGSSGIGPALSKKSPKTTGKQTRSIEHSLNRGTGRGKESAG
ncbi:MAG TPA: dUTP diphosphatase [bacterium]